MFSGAAVSTGKVDSAFFLIVGICVLLLMTVVTLMVIFVVRYRRKRHPVPQAVKESTLLEIIWTVIPLMLVMVMFYFGWVDFEYIRNPPRSAMTVRVIGRQWSWLFRYDNGREDDVLRVPLGQAVKLLLTSEDVIHSFFVPAFRIKEDCVPGMTTHLWFRATEPGDYEAFCTEYCGLGHSHMRTRVVVLPRAEFDAWYRSAPAGAASPGLAALKAKGCLGCHSLDGSAKVGPSFKGLLGRSQVVVRQGRRLTVRVDAAYIKSYILNPNVDVVQGFPPIMPKLVLTEKELAAILSYLEAGK